MSFGRRKLKFEHIGREHVLAAIQEFDWTGVKPMLKKYKCKRSTRWYICFGDRLYDQKLILWAAHAHAGDTSDLDFTAGESRKHFAKLGFTILGFTVVEGCCKTT